MGIEVGSVLEGKVTGIKSFGAFVALPEGKNGLVHISEVSNAYVEDINTVLKEGEAVKVKVLSIAEDGKIALSIKRLLPREPRPDQRERGNSNRGDHGDHGNYRGNGGQRPNGQRRAPRNDAPRVWQPKKVETPENMSFEDMMSRFKSQSEDKLASLNADAPHNRRGSYGNRSRRK